MRQGERFASVDAGASLLGRVPGSGLESTQSGVLGPDIVRRMPRTTQVKLRAMQKLLPNLARFVGVLVLLSAGAARASDLYAAEMRVADEGSETRNAALSTLLGNVLVKVSGNPAVTGQPAARDLLAKAPSLVQQYRYRTADEDGQLVRYLWTRFDRASVDRMMRERNLPVWSQRPGVLLWVASESSGRREMLNFDTAPALRSAVANRARERGMPLQLPLMDLEDQGALTPADIWSDYLVGIRSASMRYPHDVVLVGRMREGSGGSWSGSWSMIGSGGVQRFDSRAGTQTAVLLAAIDQAQDRLAVRHAPAAPVGEISGTLVRFSGVYDLAAYGRLLALLEPLPMVDQMALRHVQGDNFTFEFQLGGSEREMIGALGAEPVLVADSPPLRAPQGAGGSPDDGGSPPPRADLYYRLLD